MRWFNSLVVPGEVVDEARVVRHDRKVLRLLALVVLQLRVRAVLLEEVDKRLAAVRTGEHQWCPASEKSY